MAEEALALYVDGLVEDGKALPEPSTLVVKFKRLSPPEVRISRYKLLHAAVPSVRFRPLDVVMELPDSKGGVAIRVAVKTEAPKCTRVNVMLPEDILERIDKCATSRGLTRSAFLTRAAKRELETA